MPVQHVKLARDRRKKRAYIKVGVFFVAILLILTGILLTIKDKSEENPVFSTADNMEYHALNTSPSKTPQNSTALQSDENATSYDDELQAKDDEVDEIKPPADDFDTLPQHAQDALNGVLDAADQAIRITDQFSYTVTEGDTLKDVLALSGLDDLTVQQLLALDPDLAHLKAGQQFYWVLDKSDNLEYLNWLVSEKEERVYERVEDGQFKRQLIEKKSIWRKEVLKGEINGSFSASLKAQGLDNRQISQLTTALQWQVSIQKLKKGTQFAILVSREYLGDKLTGLGNVEALRISFGGKNCASCKWSLL